MNPSSGDPHGDNTRQRARSLGIDPATVIDLACSLHPGAPSVASVLAGVLHEVDHYPDPAPATAALAAAIGVEPDRLLLTNGASEAIALLAGHLGHGTIVEPEFALYRRHLGPHGSKSQGGEEGRWRSNPNNPLGTLAAADAVAQVWDEAFYPIATGCWTRGDEHAWRIGSLTKLWACPGLRLGYVIAPDAQERAAIAARQPRWSVNGLALAIIEPMLARTDLLFLHRHLVEARAALVELLRSVGLDVHETSANWVLVTAAGDLATRLAHQGIFVRDCASFGLAETVRIAVPRRGDVPALHDALHRLFSRPPLAGARRP